MSAIPLLNSTAAIVEDNSEEDFPAMYLIGTLTGWERDENFRMSTDDGVYYTLSGIDIPEGSEFKFFGGDWSIRNFGSNNDYEESEREFETWNAVYEGGLNIKCRPCENATVVLHQSDNFSSVSILIHSPQEAPDLFVHKGILYQILDHNARTCSTRPGSTDNWGNYTSGNTQSWSITLCENPVFDGTEYRLTEIAPYSFCHNIPDSPFSIIIPPTVSIIRHHAFFLNFNLENVSFAEGLKSIENQAFVNCSLKSLQLPASLESIGRSAFGDLKRLTEVVIPSAVKEIGERAFCGCAVLEAVSIPASVSSFGEHIFQACPDIKNIDYDTGNPIEGSLNMFESQVYIDAKLTMPDTGVKTNTVPWLYFATINGKASGTGVFTENNMLYLPTDEKTGEATLFKGFAESVSGDIVIPSVISHNGKDLTVTAIHDYALANCPAIESLSLPSSLKSIGDYAFSYCDGLKDIRYYSDIPAEGAKSIFESYQDLIYSDATLHVTPEAEKSIREISPWMYFSNITADLSEVKDIDEETWPSDFDIFTIQGICLKRGASRADIEALPSGLYIVDGRKVRR